MRKFTRYRPGMEPDIIYASNATLEQKMNELSPERQKEIRERSRRSIEEIRNEQNQRTQPTV